MLQSYLKIAIRNLFKNKVYSLITIAGLSLGISCCLIIGIYVWHELSYDRFFPDAQRIYRVVQEQEQARDLYRVAYNPPPLVAALKTDYPAVREVTGFAKIFTKQLFQYQDKSFEEADGFYVDTTFFTFFPFAVKQGSLQPFFTSNNALLLTEDMAYKYFGEDDPIGKTINLDRGQDFAVAAVLEKPPKNSHIKFNYLLPMESLRAHRDFDSWAGNWVNTYVLLQETADAHAFETSIQTLLSDNIDNPNWQPRLYLQALTDIHLRSNFDFNTDFADTSSLQSIYLFGAIGLIIMLISCINFINLSTARSFQRSKEIGIRKVVGASRRQLVYQFMGESLLFTLIATALAITITQLVISYFARLSGSPLALSLLGTENLLFLLLAILIITGLLAGMYPALFLSAFNAIKILKGYSFLHRNTSTLHLSMRKIMVISQFTLSVILIVSAIIIRQQMHYVLNRSLGFDQEHILYTPVKGELVEDTRYQSFKNTLLQQSSIVQVTQSSGLPIDYEGSFGGIEWEGMPDDHQEFLLYAFDTDEAFVETFGLKLLAGSNFSPRKPGDSTIYYLVNETALKVMQMDDPIGKTLETGEIIGVVNDFNFKTAFAPVEPMILRSRPKDRKRFIAIRIAVGTMAEALNAIERTYQQFNPDYPVEYNFLDESINDLYDQQIRSGKLINVFAGLAVFISCLGLFGLSTFSAEQRTKEVGIRKVLGATVLQVTQLLSFSFLRLIGISVLIALPCAYWIIRYWLDEFAYRIPLVADYFIIAGIVAIVIAGITISFQTVKAALTNPVNSLRNE
ncbi:MAG: ABC transporter permease [Cyclobacteriaceae bacterium]